MKRFSTIGEFLQFRQLPQPEHPLICVFKVEAVERVLIEEPKSWLYDFYAIGLKRVSNAKEARLKYGQQQYDFDNGIMSFVAPGQVLSLSLDDHVKLIKQSGWMMLIHPDFLWNTSLAQAINRYDFWDYTVHEALFLSEREEATLVHIMQEIQRECQSNIDKFTKSIIISHIETLLNYADRFYHRQFITREKAHHRILERLEKVLNDYFNSDDLIRKGLPTVSYLAQSLNLSPKYLSSLLKVLTGENTQQHIHRKVIEKAKEKLSTTNLSVSEIAYELGFEHIQSFSKLFRTKTNQSPMEFRQSFN
ncbi:helix-turn-helix domain-containing protein [Chitinophaga pinensis]|uniref:Transcriptional regulator, AraC family n=1 Tax=Chitinophaga pinensis (strain ATCC 43595 / DSM 2588 / LMG 13176 / NBRC 15968 / NCIMB 11800 / UQM 2034) TaxID=485918 RepID=A0A979G525_CHIPD|nr:response regulator transcription factor [Chitinophaga pinensis]ACU60989.1 transcriptional regulator, AraC family [Chitinophaga pinensis DSM 2588]